MTLDGRIKIHVTDDVAKTTNLLHRTLWRNMRDIALARWEAAGLKFVVAEGLGRCYTKLDYDGPGYYISPLALPKCIRLIRDDIMDDENTDMTAYNMDIDGSVCAFTLTRHDWTKLGRRELAYTITHEVGHCLGLDHGGGGVMEGNFKPNEHDLESVRGYYHA